MSFICRDNTYPKTPDLESNREEFEDEGSARYLAVRWYLQGGGNVFKNLAAKLFHLEHIGPNQSMKVYVIASAIARAPTM